MPWAPSRPARRSERPALSEPRPTEPAARRGVPGPPGARIEVDGLTWRPYGRAEPVLRDLTLSIAAGERVLLAGPSGSGKSTLLRAIAGLLLTADSGELTGSVHLGTSSGEAEADASGSGQVGLVLQDPGAGVVAASLGRDVAFGLENLGMPRAAMAAPAAAALAEVGLTMSPDASPMSLSGGEQQRLALAGALAMSPRVLLLDEPTAMLDPETAASVTEVVGDVVRRRGLTTVIVEHRIGVWLDLVDRMVVLDAAGRIVADGPPDDMLAAHGAELLAAGIWVPGVPDPEPVDLGGLFDPSAGPRSEAVVVARDVTVRRVSRPLNGPERVTTAVAGVDLEVRGGHTVAVVGPSGAGKSTLLTALGGLVAPTSGTVRLAEPLGHGPPDRWPSPQLATAVAWVPQRAASTIVRRTVRDEVEATGLAVGLDAAAVRTRADLLLDRLGLLHLVDADPRRLSGGEQRRLAVAASAVHQPALVLADEPTVGQDRATWAAVLGVFEALRAAGSAVVVATHDAAVVGRADEVVAMAPPPQPAAPAAASRPRVRLAARCGPLSLLAVCLLVLPLPALLGSWRQALAVIAVQLVLAVVALWAPRTAGHDAPAVPVLRRTLLRAWPPLLGVLGVAWSTWLLGGHDVEIAAGAALRVVAIVLPSVVLLPFVDPDALGDHLAQRLHLPARPVVAASAALHRFQSFGALWSELTLARRVRGVGAGRSLIARGREVGATTFGLFVGILGQAATLALAMDARGFARAYHRTWAGPAPWRVADSVALAAGLVPALVALALRLP